MCIRDRALRFAVEDSLRTEDIGDGRLGGSGEFSVPLAVCCNAIQIFIFCLNAFCDLLLLLGGGLSEFLLDRKLHFNLWILGVGYGEGWLEGQLSVRRGPFAS